MQKISSIDQLDAINFPTHCIIKVYIWFILRIYRQRLKKDVIQLSAAANEEANQRQIQLCHSNTSKYRIDK